MAATITHFALTGGIAKVSSSSEFKLQIFNPLQLAIDCSDNDQSGTSVMIITYCIHYHNPH